MSTTRIFVDTSAWIALFDTRDRRHREGTAFWSQMAAERPGILTSDYVLDETFTLLRRCRNGLAAAIACHDLIAASRVVEVASIDRLLRRQAWTLFTRYDDQILSFTDCTSFALMEARKITDAFTFDADFRRVGLVTRPVPSERR